MKQPILRVTDLRVELDQNLILDHVNFVVNKNDTLSIIGPNGSGKTTLFRALLGLIPYQGKIEWEKNSKIGYVPQKLYIDHDLPLTTNEFFNLKKATQKQIEFVLSSVGLKEDVPHKNHLKEHILNEKIGLLSGGELQRVLIAWALLGNPDVLLFDEPTSGIDITGEETIYTLIHRLQRNSDLTILLISHELQVVYKHATNVVCLNKEQVCFGSPKEVLNQETLNTLFGESVGIYQHH